LKRQLVINAASTMSFVAFVKNRFHQGPNRDADVTPAFRE
jgi:hypothetical protein